MIRTTKPLPCSFFLKLFIAVFTVAFIPRIAIYVIAINGIDRTINRAVLLHFFKAYFFSTGIAIYVIAINGIDRTTNRAVLPYFFKAYFFSTGIAIYAIAVAILICCQNCRAVILDRAISRLLAYHFEKLFTL